MSKAHLPPVPPANRTTKGPGPQGNEGEISAEIAETNKESKERHLGEQGRQGNVKQNTTHQGYQQDR
ncbi:MAG: hypothetical protein IRY87_02025 [Acetobacteraceae bacterium]|nr:hypothetical protein [Acetobacteraceae bacterium]